jgi:hypothetical protein
LFIADIPLLIFREKSSPYSSGANKDSFVLSIFNSLSLNYFELFFAHQFTSGCALAGITQNPGSNLVADKYPLKKAAFEPKGFGLAIK